MPIDECSYTPYVLTNDWAKGYSNLQGCWEYILSYIWVLDC